MQKLFRILLILGTLIGFIQAQTNRDSLYHFGMKKEWSRAQIDDYLSWEKAHFNKGSAGSLRQSAIMNGNKITTEIWNFGSISSPGNTITDIVWEGLGYGYEFGPFVGAEVSVPKGSHPDVLIKRKANGDPVTTSKGDTVYVAHVLSDGLKSNGGESSPDNLTRWSWQPLIQSDDGKNEFLSLDSKFMPTSDDRDRDGDGKPDSWPEGFYNANLRSYVWPGALGQGATNADKETFYVMDDRDNKEFKYYPYPNDSLRQGLGLEVEGRYYQWSNAQAEDAIFLIYKIKNKGHYDLNDVIFGMWGDPHIGGPADWQDDWANFDKELNMTFAWDNDGKSLNNPDLIPGYLGYKFLESPGNSTDGIDNDGDGMIDESWTDGIDNDGDWNENTDDVGIDGVPNTGDQGEKDGLPTAGDPFDITKPGEPNFEFTDIDESDMIGLTSFAQPGFSGLHISDDERIWRDYIQPGQFDTTQIQGDYVFLYGSGKFTLKSIFKTDASTVSDAIKRFSIALIIGADRSDLILNAVTVQKIYNSGYQFAKPPAKPRMTLVPGDRKVTIYWDNVAESSVDPISKEKDFEGYFILRSTDPKFLDQQTISDANGNSFLFSPLKTANGAPARFDLKNGITGVSSVPFASRGVSYYLGDDTGLRHVYVDSNNVINGQTYFYAVVSYDHGSDSLRIPPSECAKIVSFNPVTNEYSFDINTGRVIPRVRSAGYKTPEINNSNINSGIVREKGFSTGKFAIDIIDERKVEDNNKFKIVFDKTDEKTSYSVLDEKEKSETFTSYFENFVPLSYPNLLGKSIIVSSRDESIEYQNGVDYVIDTLGASIMVFDPAIHSGATMMDATGYLIKYINYPLFHSTLLDSEINNPIFDGLRLVVKETSFRLNNTLTGWSASSRADLKGSIIREPAYAEDPFDYEFQFFDHIVDTAVTKTQLNFKVLDVANNVYMDVAVTEKNSTKNKKWDLGEPILLLRGGHSSANIVWRVDFSSITGDTVLPGPNDKFYLATDKPFSKGDVFSFESRSATIDRQLEKNQLGNINVVPNPYVATNVIEQRNTTSRTTRGYRRLYFNHLPSVCTIRIYTQAGELVKTLEHNSTIDDGKEFWDLLTKDNMEVAYGLYFFHIDAPGIGKRVGKFVIIK